MHNCTKKTRSCTDVYYIRVQNECNAFSSLNYGETLRYDDLMTMKRDGVRLSNHDEVRRAIVKIVKVLIKCTALRKPFESSYHSQ